MKVALFRVSTAVGAAMLLSGCAGLLAHKGSVIDPQLASAIQPGIDNKASVEKLLGRPSFTGQFTPNDWYYVSRDTKQVGFRNPRVTRQTVLHVRFDQAGNVMKTMGGPGPGYEWGTQVHGVTVDSQGNVWIGFGGGLPYDPKKPHTTDNAHVIKFGPDGKFLLQVGKFGKGTEGSNSTQYLGNPTDVYVDVQANEAYISDGYINHRLIVVDAKTGAYKRHWGAYGKKPDDTAMPPQGSGPALRHRSASCSRRERTLR